MFNNLVSIHDLSRLFQEMKQGSRVFSRLIGGKQERIEKAWAHLCTSPRNWWDIPAIRERWNCLISGDPQVDYYEYISQKYLTDRDALCALSVGCGSGHRELRWAELGRFECIDAYDLSEPRIRHAISNANQKGYSDIINYRVGDMYSLEVCENYYDVVLAEQSLHHFSPLDEILVKINRFLKPNGYFIVNEFVGPTRFQWTDRQLEVTNGLLSVFPLKYKTVWDTNSIKAKIFKPGRLRMMLSDPSEAVESSKIMPLLYEIFDVIEVKEYGGTILHLLFSGIAHNFISEDMETRRLLKICFEVEDLLLTSGDIQSDFVVAICKKSAKR